MSPDIVLRRTTPSDLDFVIELERDAQNARFIGQWSRDEHRSALDRSDREHWIVTDGSGERLGYIIVYDVRDLPFTHYGRGVYVKRIVVGPKSTGVGRRALGVLLEHAFRDLRAAYVSLAVFRANERAQRAYLAAGFQVAPLSREERLAMRAEVDDFHDDCLVMIALRD